MNLCSKWTTQISCFDVSSNKCEILKEEGQSFFLRNMVQWSDWPAVTSQGQRFNGKIPVDTIEIETSMLTLFELKHPCWHYWNWSINSDTVLTQTSTLTLFSVEHPRWQCWNKHAWWHCLRAGSAKCFFYHLDLFKRSKPGSWPIGGASQHGCGWEDLITKCFLYT